MRGFKFGASYSFATTDQEEPEITSNNRLLALGGNYEDGSIGVYFGATHVWHGKTSAASADRGKLYTRADAQAYTLGATYRPTDAWKFYSALQYHKNLKVVQNRHDTQVKMTF